MNSNKMFLSLVPWVLFSVVINRHGANAAAVAAAAAAVLSFVLLTKDAQKSGVKVIDVTGVVTFSAFAVIGFIGGQSVDNWIADYGRGTAAAILAAIMLGSAITVPFTEQYARETVPREYWGSPVFRAVNRRISALWGGVVAIMAAGHLLAGRLDPASNPNGGSRPIDLILNWGLPILLILFAIKQTKAVSENAAGRGLPDAQSIPQPPQTQYPSY